MPRAKKPQSSTKHKKGDESIEASAAKELYISMGRERSLEKAAALMGRPEGYVRKLKEWSRTFGWVELARKHDEEEMRELGKKFKEEQEAASADCGKKHHLQGYKPYNKFEKFVLLFAKYDVRMQEEPEPVKAPAYDMKAAQEKFQAALDAQREAIMKGIVPAVKPQGFCLALC